MTESNWQAATEALQSDHGQRIEQLVDWCQQPSGSYDREALESMADRLDQDFSSELGLPTKRVGMDVWEEVDDQTGQTQRLETGPGLLWQRSPDAERRVLLLIHYDTVYPRSLPHRVFRQDDRLLGPGTADAKGGIAVILAALSVAQRFDLAPSVGWTVALNPDEEIGSPASRRWLQQLARQHDFAMVFEPSLPCGAWVAQRKGSGNWHAIVEGRSAHSGRDPEAGRNAIVQAAKLAQQLAQLNDPASGRTVNVARFHGGGPLNRVPDRVVLRWNVRIDDPADEAFLEGHFAELAARFSGDGYRVRVGGGLHAPVKRLTPAIDKLRDALAVAAASCDRPVAWQDTGGACDGSKLAAFGLPNIDTLGPTGGALHSPDEFALVDSFVPAARVVARTLYDFERNPERFPSGAST